MSENAIHRAVADLLTRIIAPPGKARDGVCWYSIEHKCKTRSERMERASRGVIAGIPDIQILSDGRAFLIELKKADGRTAKAQKEMHTELNVVGVPVALCRSVDDVAAALRHWAIPCRRVS